jgi:hydroxymethylpyrimidine/phosphomethylpyrimidine kinase
MALAPCLLGYFAVARMLHDDTARTVRKGNTYWPWIQNYVADDYVEAVRLGSGMLRAPSFSPLQSVSVGALLRPALVLTDCISASEELLEKHAQLQSPAQIEELVKIFVHATKMEIGFWDMFPHQ